MVLFNKFHKSLDRSINRPPFHAVLREYFLNLETSDSSPLKLAMDNLKQIEETAKGPEEMAFFFLEDIIFSSLTATFYEQLIMALKEHNYLASELLEKFNEDRDEREREVAYQTQDHVNFIQKFGQCPGCLNCENHEDIKDLLPFWEDGDLEFFRTLFIGMQTIQLSFEFILQDLIPDEADLFSRADEEEILKFRQFVMTYVEDHQEDKFF